MAGHAAVLPPSSMPGAIRKGDCSASSLRLGKCTTQGFAPLFWMISDRIETFLADRGYDANAIRDEIASVNVEAVISSKANRPDPIPHGKAKYRWRNQI